MASLEVSQVVGSGSAQELICQFITFPAPAEEVKEIRKTVIIDNCMPVFDKVIIDGRLRKDILFKQANAGFPLPGNVQACVGTTTTITGTILDVDVDIAFNMVIPVPGATPGDRCVVLQAFVEGEKEEAANIQPTGTFLTLVDKSIVFVCVKVVRETITSTLAGGAAGGAAGTTTMAAICPPRRSTGFFPGGAGTIPPPRPGLLPGTFIGPTLLFSGVLNPGIPTTIPVASVPTGTGTSSQVQVTATGTAATTGDMGAAGGTMGTGTTIP
jgi:hypothetical protein